MDSTCLGEIVSGFVTVRKNSGIMHLANPNPRVGRLLEIAGLTTIFKTFPTDEEAIAGFVETGPPS